MKLVLYLFDRSVHRMSQRFSADPANNFLSIYGDFGELSEKLFWALLSAKVKKIQRLLCQFVIYYVPTKYVQLILDAKHKYLYI